MWLKIVTTIQLSIHLSIYVFVAIHNLTKSTMKIPKNATCKNEAERDQTGKIKTIKLYRDVFATNATAFRWSAATLGTESLEGRRGMRGLCMIIFERWLWMELLIVFQDFRLEFFGLSVAACPETWSCEMAVVPAEAPECVNALPAYKELVLKGRADK